MKQRLINTRKIELEYIDALHSKAVNSQNFARESFRGSFTSLVQRVETLFTQDLTAVSKSVDDCGSVALISFAEEFWYARRLLRVGLFV